VCVCGEALMVDKLKSESRVDGEQAQQLQDILMRPHKHKHRKVNVDFRGSLVHWVL